MVRSIRVLLVDDEKSFVDSLGRILVRRGMEIRAAYDGATAVASVAKEDFDVIVLDMRMPGMDGLATLEHIRRQDSLTPVLLLSGYIDLERTTMALKGGVAEILLKPCPIDALISAIENASERKGIAREVAERSR